MSGLAWFLFGGLIGATLACLFIMILLIMGVDDIEEGDRG